jgi:two-component system response regulator CpxR
MKGRAINARSTEQEQPSTGQTSVLLVDDDIELCSLMSEYFSQHGCQFSCTYDGARGLAEALRRTSLVPVIMLTARTQERDRIAGLDAGADDYLLKPFGPDELLARIHAVLRRVGQLGLREESISVGDLHLNPRARQVQLAHESVELTSIEFDILSLLMRSVGRILSRDEIATTLYQRESTSFERSVDVHICHLRKKLEGSSQTLIQTVRGAGYLFSSSK